ncbi:MAG: hypothetical protein WBQ34_08570 [Candidatus Acidiferrales bacterium]
MKIKTSFLALSLLFFILAAQEPLLGQTKAAKTNPVRLIAECASDGVGPTIPYPGRHEIASIADAELEADLSDEATFWFMREPPSPWWKHPPPKEIFTFSLDDLSVPTVWIAVDHDPGFYTYNQARVALTYSDGGAIGGFHVRVFLIDANGVKDVSTSIDAAVTDFKSRHYCEARGNNVTALKWIRGKLLLSTEVYPDSDCGPDAGHLEGYLVSVPEGKILEHMTLNQLKNYPGVCLENDNEGWTPTKPNAKSR